MLKQTFGRDNFQSLTKTISGNILSLPITFTFLACVASVSVWFRSKEIPRKGTFGFDRARNESRAKKWKRGEGEGKEGKVSFLSSPPPSRSFTWATFLAVFDSRSSFFSPKPYRNACYAGYYLPQTWNFYLPCLEGNQWLYFLKSRLLKT